MNILFLGNSLLIALMEECLKDNRIFGSECNYSFAIQVGGWGPSFKIENNKLVPENIAGENKEKWPDFFYPPDVLNNQISFFDVIVVCALGSIGGGLEESTSICNLGQIFEFNPKPLEGNIPTVTKAEMLEMFPNWLNAQPGIQLLDYLKNVSSKIVLIEMPYLSEDIIENPEWSLGRLYRNPEEAYKWFASLRCKFLKEKADGLNYNFIPALFGDLGFTPREYVSHNDLFHTNAQYAKLLLRRISEVLIDL